MENESDLITMAQNIQRVIEACVACKWEDADLDHIVVVQAFRLLLVDLIGLFHLMNEAVVALLGRFL